MIRTDFDKKPSDYVPKDVNDPDKRSPFIRGKELAAQQGKVFNPCPFCIEDGNAENADVMDHRQLCKHYIGMSQQGQNSSDNLTHYHALQKRLEVGVPESEAPFTYLSGKLFPIPDGAGAVWVTTSCRIYHRNPDSVLPPSPPAPVKETPKSTGEAVGAAILSALQTKPVKVKKPRKNKVPVAAGE